MQLHIKKAEKNYIKLESGSIGMKSNHPWVTWLTLVALVSVIIPLPSISELPMGPPPANGDWVVADSTSINDTSIIVNGNLTITNAGSLNLTNVSLVMNGNITVEGKFILRNVTVIFNITDNKTFIRLGITVEAMGLMHILDYDDNPGTDDGSKITSATPDGRHSYTFWVKAGSKFRMENSILQECGYSYLSPGLGSDSSNGLLIEANYTQIKNCTIDYTKNCIIFQSANNNTIYNCTFSRGTSYPSNYYGKYGLTLISCSKNLVSDCRFYNLSRSIYMVFSDNNTVLNCNVNDSVKQVSSDRQTLGINAELSNYNRFINNSEENIFMSMSLASCYQTIVRNHIINGTANGIIVMSGCSFLTLENIKISNLISPYSTYSTLGLFFYENNSNINVINCSISGVKNSYINGIFLALKGTTSNYLFRNCTVENVLIALGLEESNMPMGSIISNVIIENCRFNGEQHAFATLIDLNNWSFSNCSFIKSSGLTSYNLWNGVITIAGNAQDTKFSDCDFRPEGPGLGSSSVAITSPYRLIKFDIDFDNCRFTNNSEYGLVVSNQGSNIWGSLSLDNCSINDNRKSGIFWLNADVILDLNNSKIFNNWHHGIHPEMPGRSIINIENSTIFKNKNSGMSILTASAECMVNISNSIFMQNNNNGLEIIYSSPKLNIRESQFINNQESGLNISNCRIDIKDCNITNNNEVGINILDCLGNFSENDIMNNGLAGVIVNDSSGNLLVNRNMIKNNGQGNDLAQMYIIESSLELRNNTFTSGPGISSGSGLKILGSSQLMIDDNTFNGNFIKSIIDISASEVQIQNNQLQSSNPEANGIYIHDSGSYVIEANTITAPGKNGILIEADPTSTITGNIITGWERGLDIINSSITVYNNTIQSSQYCGIHINDYSNANVNDNLLINNRHGAIICGTAVFNHNTVRSSNGAGIYIKPEAQGSLIGNTLTANNIGVLAEGGMLNSNQNLIKGNTYGYSLINQTSGVFNGDIISDNDVGVSAEASNFILSGYSLMGNNDTISLVNSVCRIYNSTITDSDHDFILDESSNCWVINTGMPEAGIDIIDNASHLERQWFLNITIVDLQDQAVKDVDVIIKDRIGVEIFNGKSSVYGTINGVNLTSMSWSIEGRSDPNPFKVILSKKDYGTTENELNFTGNTNSTFTAYKLSELITNIKAIDTPNDQGGSIILNWTYIPILNFDHYNIYVDTEYISDATQLSPINKSITNQVTNSIVISESNDFPLENGITYYFAVTVVDSNGYEDWTKVTCSNGVIPIDNLSPRPIRNLTAYDTPNDNGGSITIQWELANERDFDYYALYFFYENISDDFELLNQTPKLKLRDISQTSLVLEDLNDKYEYYFVMLVFDVNGNVNLSYEIIGPIMSRDNLPPIIDRNASTPSISISHEFYSDESNMFRVYLETNYDVTFQWYLDGEFQANVTGPYLFVTMVDLEEGFHNLTVIVEEESGLQDSLSWNFTVTTVPEPPEKESPSYFLLWVALTVIILIVLLASFFSIRNSYRYLRARKTISLLPGLGDSDTITLIENKREQGDKYLLGRMVKDSPEVLRSNPDKLFFILKLLAKDETTEIRDNASINIARLLESQPQNAFLWLKSLQQLGVNPEVYLIISKSSRNVIIKELVKAYYTNLTATNEEEYRAGLENTTRILQSTGEMKFGREVKNIYSTLNDFYKYRTVSKISTSRPVIDRLQTTKIGTYGILYPEAFEVFRRLGLVADTLGKYEKVDGVEDKLSYLSQGLNGLEEAAKAAREKLAPPEREIFLLVLNSWRNIITLSIRELRGRADLNLVLIGKEAVAERDTLTLMLEIENTGRSTAERVLVELVPLNDYVVKTGPQELGSIGHMRKKEVTFELKPTTHEGFRVEFIIHYDDAERKGKSLSFGDLVTLIELGAEFQEFPNPYIVGTPIKTGSKLFVGRRDLIEFIHKNIRGSLQENIIVLIGHRRTGKTTLLKQLPVYLEKNFIPVYIDIQGIIDPGMDAFFYLLATEIVTAMQERGLEISKPAFGQFKERPSYYFEYEFLKEVYEKLGDSILILMFDEFEELEVKVDSGLLDKNIFSYLRHLMQHTKQLAFIFTGTSRLEDLKTDYWSIMFNIALYKRVSFLSEAETRELIIEPVRKYNMIYDSLAVEKIYRLTSGHPYFTQLLCHALVNLHNNQKKNYITIQDVNGELYRIIERGQMHFDFIWDKSTIQERLVMTTLTKSLQEEDAVTVSSIVNRLLTYDLLVDSNEITKTLDILASKEIIEKIMDHTTTYEFKVDLIRIWLETTKHLDQVVEEYRLKP
ncbi:right-handed parallel beta-helix repeat-containing protein [[Eubacterium] cellulosolvens]